MLTELRLWFTDETGITQQATVNTNSFTIGRQRDNDLALSDPGLSRRHAVLTRVDNVVQIADCGSHNGTFVNGRQIAGAVRLHDGDVITLGHACELQVQFVASEISAPKTRINFRSPLALATTTIAGIVLLAGGLMFILHWQKQPKAATPISPSPRVPLVSPSPLPTPTPPISIEKLVLQALQKISLEQTYALSPEVQDEIERRIAQSATPTLAQALRTLKTQRTEFQQQAQTAQLNPYLLTYLALAATDGGQHGDPLTIARRAAPRLHDLKIDMGGNSVDSNLLILAAYQAPIRLSVQKTAQTDRNVWYLHQHGAISDAAYDFVLRFLAYGAIAQNPSRFALDAPVLVF